MIRRDGCDLRNMTGRNAINFPYSSLRPHRRNYISFPPSTTSGQERERAPSRRVYKYIRRVKATTPIRHGKMCDAQSSGNLGCVLDYIKCCHFDYYDGYASSACVYRRVWALSHRLTTRARRMGSVTNP